MWMAAEVSVVEEIKPKLCGKMIELTLQKQGENMDLNIQDFIVESSFQYSYRFDENNVLLGRLCSCTSV